MSVEQGFGQHLLIHLLTGRSHVQGEKPRLGPGLRALGGVQSTLLALQLGNLVTREGRTCWGHLASPSGPKLPRPVNDCSASPLGW